MQRTVIAIGLIVMYSVGMLAAQSSKIQQLDSVYDSDERLMAVMSFGPQQTRCVAVSLGWFAILTSFDCLEAMWKHRDAGSVFIANDRKRQHFNGTFRLAHSNGPSEKWALLETNGHTAGYWGFQDLVLESRIGNCCANKTFNFIGFSKKVKGGRELAIQKNCQLERESLSIFISECGRDFDSSGILIVAGHQEIVGGIATVSSTTKVGKSTRYRLSIVSLAQYGSTLDELKRDEKNRMSAVMEQREAAAAERRQESTTEVVEFELERQARARRAAQRKADVEKLIAAVGALGGAKAGAVPVERQRGDAASRGAANTGELNRACRHQIGGEVVYPQVAVAPSGGGSLRISVNIASGCRWRLELASRLEPWLTSTSTLDGLGAGQFEFTADPLQAGPPQSPDVHRSVAFTFRNLSSPDYDHVLRVSQCAGTITRAACAAFGSQ